MVSPLVALVFLMLGSALSGWAWLAMTKPERAKELYPIARWNPLREFGFTMHSLIALVGGPVLIIVAIFSLLKKMTG